MASVNRQSQFKTIGEAVQVYTEGIKNNNAMQTDSTGISENLAVTLKKKGLSMDDLNNKSKRALVLQEIYNAHTKEASAYQGAYTQQMQGYQGQVIKANSAMSKILETTGNFIKSGLTPLLAIANPVMGFFSDSERGAGRTAMALTLLTTAIGVGLVSATWSWVASLNAVAIAKAVAFAEIIGIALAIAAAITAVYLVFEDIFVFLEYGPAASETFFGDLLRWLGLGEVELQALSDGFHNFKTVIGEVWDSIGTKISNFIESISNAFAWAKENSRLFGAVAVSALVVLSPLLIEIGAAAFATGVEMVAAFLSASIQASISFVAMQLGYIKLAATALWAGGQMAVAWLIGLGPIGWAGLAIAALAGIVFYYWNEISAKTTGLWAGIGNAFDNGVKWIVTKWDSIKQSFSKLIKWMQPAFWDTVEFIKKAAILAGKLLLTFLFPLAGLYLFKDEIKAVFEWLWNLFKNTDIGKFFIDSFLSMKATLSASLSGIFESAKTAFMGLIPTDALNMMIDSINWVLEKLNDFSSSKVASALGMDPLNLQMIAHIQAREMGGPIEAGIPYFVGEKGPELRTFSQSGSIIPNNKMNDYQPAGSGGSISILVNAVINSGAEVANIATDLLSEIEKALEDNKNSIREKFGLTPRYA